jgi:methyl acetate hydrolase
MKRLPWFIPLLLVATVSAAPTLPQQGIASISAVLTAAVDRGDIPGVVVAVVNKDGVLYHEAFGKSSTLANTPMAKDTIFNMASMTKPVTSIAIMMLADEGKLKLDDDVAKFLPKWKDPQVFVKFNDDGTIASRPAKRAMTIRHLLTHTSGIGYGFSNPTLGKMIAATKKGELDQPLLFDPGDSWAYGASTRVLGHVVEQISGQKLDAFFDDRILKPLAMHDTGYAVPPANYDRVVAVNTRGADGKFVERPKPAKVASQVGGDGGLYGTAGDYGQFLRMLLNRGSMNGKRFLAERTVKTIFENHMGGVLVSEQQSTNPALSKNFPLGAGKDRWGLGFQLAAERLPNRRSPGSGTWAGINNTHFVIDTRREIGIIVMTQVLPFYDDAMMKVYAGVEEAVYKHLK